jgi:peptidyl-prolyl cis-trans isomerase B (cyclophilin B)
MRTIVATCVLFVFAQGPPGLEPAAVLNVERAWAGADMLMPLVSSRDPTIRRFALRAIGRLEDPHLVPNLLALAPGSSTPEPALAGAIAQSLHGFDPRADPALIAAVAALLRTAASADDPLVAASYLMPLGRIAYATPEQVHGAETILRTLMDRTADSVILSPVYVLCARSIDALARANAKTTRFSAETSVRLSRSVAHTALNDGDKVRALAMSALIAAGALDAETEKTALQDGDADVRRLATTVLAGAGAGIDADARVALLQERLSDASPFVRYEAIRGYLRRGGPDRKGCRPLVDLLDDPDSHVMLAAIDSFANACRSDADITARLASELRVPQASGGWNRDAHIFLTLAKRAPETTEISMQAFVTHPVWWVRMYAAEAAAAMDDVVRLDELAYDANDNVRAAALGPLYRLKKREAEPAIIAALARPDYQLVRDAAILLKDAPPDDKFATPLVGALVRITKEGKETSRDARLPLLEAIDVHAPANAAEELRSLLKDFDPVVAGKAADVIAHLTGKAVRADPQKISRGWPRQFHQSRPQMCVAVQLASGGVFYMQMDQAAAPIAVDRFLTLAVTDHYYDGLTFHRVVPNFVVQGGSPGANEYSGAKNYMRDEVAASNDRGTVGLSTRGRNTADAQFYINLVDNHRLDDDYTVFATVTKGMDVVDGLEEGAGIQRIELSHCAP